MPALYVGTSGWNYPGWRPQLYGDAPQRLWLDHYARRFNSVEVDATFYRLQSHHTFDKWRAHTPAPFRFAIKGHRYVTHNKKLRDAGAAIALERDRAAGLGDKLAAVLWQLPANFHCNPERLAQFAAALRIWPGVQHVLEFRHPSWFCADAAAVLRGNALANCISDAADWPRWDQVTARCVYVRLHGRPITYASGYGNRALAQWARKVEHWLGDGCDVYVYFDNDADGHAPDDAQRLQRMISV